MLPLVLHGALRIVEHLGEQVPLVLLQLQVPLHLVHRLSLALLELDRLLGFLFGLGRVQRLVVLAIVALGLHVVELTINVPRQVLFLNSFPLVAIQANRVEGVTDLLRRELAILPQGVQTDHILHFGGSVRLGLDLRPIARIVLVGLLICETFVLALLLLLEVLLLGFLLGGTIFTALECVLHTIVVGLNR